ncbi:MAG: cytochrome c biogenesis CcdA family protein [Acidimicrobiia bacterium]
MPVVLLPLLAAVAGAVSFTSPCCLPLVPGYLSYMSALPVADLGRREARALAFRASVLFVAGFTLVFSALGVAVGLLGSVVTRNLPVIVRVAGVGIIVMGLAMAGLLRLPFLYREWRVDLARARRGPRGALGLGMAFAAGWTPCIGPVLATILTAAAAAGTAAWGGVLLICYSLGLGVPFVLLAVGFTRARGSLAWLRRHGRAVETTGGVLLVAVGVLFVSGAWRTFFVPLQRSFARWGWPPI